MLHRILKASRATLFRAPVFASSTRFSTSKMPDSKVLIYLLRRDLRVSDNPIFHSLATQRDHGFTRLLPLYVFAAEQLEVKGFIPGDEGDTSPYREARSQIGGFWRCGPHRAKFLAESVWDLKGGLEKVGSGLCIRVGMVGDVVREMLSKTEDSNDLNFTGLWMVSEEGVEEAREERAVKDACREAGIEFKLWTDEKYLIDDRDLPLAHIEELSDVFTTYRKTVEPLRDHPRPILPAPARNSLPLYPDPGSIPAQHAPFVIPDSFEGLKAALLKPLTPDSILKDPPPMPSGTESAHPFHGGESKALERIEHLIASGSANTYEDTRNGLLGLDFSTKLSAYLVQGCITARQIHDALLRFEDGTNPNWSDVEGYGQGLNKGTKAIRFELLWRDYMRLCTRKFGSKLFLVSGFKDKYEAEWSNPSHPLNGLTSDQVKTQIERFINGTTGMGLIDASLREMYHTGYTSNRARQNVASFLAKHLKIDWRIGAEWYECMLVDYDLSSNWGNWQYLAGVGNDPRDGREFNPVKQAFDYDGNADYIKAWVPELRGLTEPGEAFQAWTAPEARLEELGLKDLIWVKEPLKRIPFTVNKRGRHQGRGRGGDRGDRGGRGRGGAGGEGGSTSQGQGRGGGPSSYQPPQNRGSYGGRGYGSTRGQFRGYGGARGPRGRGRGDDNTGGRDLRTGMVDKDKDKDKNFQELAEAQFANE